jgi:hypothetical protein
MLRRYADALKKRPAMTRRVLLMMMMLLLLLVPACRSPRRTIDIREPSVTDAPVRDSVPPPPEPTRRMIGDYPVPPQDSIPRPTKRMP